MEAIETLDIRQAIQARDLGRIRETLTQWEPAAVAAEIRELAADEQAVVFRILPRECAASVFEFLDVATQQDLLKALGQEQVAAILNDMAPDDRTALLEELPAAATQRLLAMLTPDERRIALQLLGYPAGSVGRLMTPHYIAVREDWTIQQCSITSARMERTARR